MEEKKHIETLIKDLFRVCDKWLDVEDFVLFEKEFSEVTKKHGYNLHEIYYGKSLEAMKTRYQRYDRLNESKGDETSE